MEEQDLEPYNEGGRKTQFFFSVEGSLKPKIFDFPRWALYHHHPFSSSRQKRASSFFFSSLFLISLSLDVNDSEFSLSHSHSHFLPQENGHPFFHMVVPWENDEIMHTPVLNVCVRE